MSAATSAPDLLAGKTGSAKASALWSLLSANPERQILQRVDRAVRIGERELRYQLQRKDDHALAVSDELLDVLAELERHGLVESELCFRLIAEGRGTVGRPGRCGAVCVMKRVEAPPIGGLVRAMVVVLVVLFFGWFLSRQSRRGDRRRPAPAAAHPGAAARARNESSSRRAGAVRSAGDEHRGTRPRASARRHRARRPDHQAQP